MRQHKYFPSALNVQGKDCLVIGDDRESREKSERLRDAGAVVTVVKPPEFDLSQIDKQFFVVYCVKTDPEMTKKVAAVCREKRVLLCAIDQPSYCDVVNVSVFDKGRMRVAIGTGGAAPAVARKIRLGLEESLKDVPLEAFLDDLAALREKLEHEIPNPKDRIPKLLEAVEGFEFKASIRFPPTWRKRTMKKIFTWFSLCLMAVGTLHAEVALFYANEAAVREGKAVIGTVIPDGLLTTAEFALSSGKDLLAGTPGNDLHRGVLVRLDNDLNVAVIRLGDVVPSLELQEAFKKKGIAMLNFAPKSTATVSADVVPLPPLVPPVGKGWELRVNGKPVGSDPILLKTMLRKSKFDVSVVCLSTSPVWGFSLKLTSNPKSAFWRQGRQMTLNDVPQPTFRYDHQALFTPLKDGKEVKLGLEAHYIEKLQEYDWTFEITSKQDALTQTVRVKFQ